MTPEFNFLASKMKHASWEGECHKEDGSSIDQISECNRGMLQ